MSLCVRKNGRIPPTNINSPWLDFFAFTIFFLIIILWIQKN